MHVNRILSGGTINLSAVTVNLSCTPMRDVCEKNSVILRRMKQAEYRILPEDQLVPLLNGGDHGAFAELFDRYHHFLARYAYKLSEDLDESNDIVQQVFVGAWENRARFDHARSLFNYLKVSVRNRFLDRERSKATQSAFKSELAAYLKEGRNTTDEFLVEKELVARLEAIARGLPGKMGKVFLMTHFEQYTNAEIAAALNISEKTARNLLSQAVANIRLRLGLAVALAMLVQ